MELRIVLALLFVSLPYLTEASIGLEIQRSIRGSAYPRGTVSYEKRRLTHNGLCTHIYPDWIVVPDSTEDVAAVVKIATKYNQPLSVRSGGHSFTCQGTKQGSILLFLLLFRASAFHLLLGGIHLDMRRMNRIGLVSPHLAVLGPGGTWADVLRELPPTKYTLIHGQCTSVGVAGYILGGGVNVVGTSERYGSAADHVVRYTMVDAQGRILLVSKGNTSVVDPLSGTAKYQLDDDHGLFDAMKGAGASYGIVTEFLYKIYPRPETLPIIALIYIENPYDLRKLEKAALDGRYHLSWFVPYAFRDLELSGNTADTALGIKVLPKILKSLAMKNVEPIFVHVVDNDPNVGRHTDRHKAMEFLKEFGIQLAKDDIFANILPNMLDLTDYEEQYMSAEEIKKRGFQGVASANLMGLSSQRLLDEFVFNHPVFGLKNKESKLAKSAGCEFCYLIVPSSARPLSRPILPLTFTGKFQVELTCMFPPNVGSRCPTVLKNIKEKFRRTAVRLGDSPSQYANTPSCDLKGRFGDRYFRPGVYEKLLKTKNYWDPENVFSHCQSIGNANEKCCPV